MRVVYSQCFASFPARVIVCSAIMYLPNASKFTSLWGFPAFPLLVVKLRLGNQVSFSLGADAGVCDLSKEKEFPMSNSYLLS